MMQDCAGVERRVSTAIVINNSLRSRMLSALLRRSITPDVVMLRGVAKRWSAAPRYAKQVQNTSH
jgi:hypothetical protein